jgi:hypothetical protein
MVSWRGNLASVIGSNAFFIAYLRDDILVIGGASPESMFKQESAEITKGGDRDLGLAKGQCCAGGGIQHPRRHDDAGALLALDEDYIGPASPLGIKQSDGTTMESVPPIVDGHFLSDTGRITPRWLSEGRICLRAATVAAVDGLCSVH